MLLFVLAGAVARPELCGRGQGWSGRAGGRLAHEGERSTSPQLWEC